MVPLLQAHIHQLVQRGVKSLGRKLSHGAGVLLRLRDGERAAEGERFRRRHAAIGVQRFLRALERLCERLQQRPIHGHLPRIGTRVGVGHKHVHMASFQRAGIDSGTKHVLQKHQIFGHPEGKVQKTVVDGFELNGDLTPVAAGARATIARHALHGTARLLASFVTLIITFP